MKPYRLHNSINTDRAWESLHNRLLQENLLTRTNERRRPYIPLPAACAAAVIIICAGITWKIISGTGTENAATAAHAVLRNEQGSATLVATLDDGSIIYLGENTRISYPTNFPQENRNIYLEGQAMFDVKNNHPHPFIISTENLTVEVTGTTFDLESTPGRLSVRQGTVKANITGNKRTVWIHPGQTAGINGTQILVAPTVDKTRFDRYIRLIRFKDEKLINILKVINNRQGSPPISADATLENRRITVTFAGNDSADNIAALICNAFEWQLNRADNNLRIAPAQH